MRFSQRIGKTPVKTAIQVESMDEPLRNALWDAFSIYFSRNDSTRDYISTGSKDAPFYRGLWHNFFKQPVDTVDDYIDHNIPRVRKWFFGAEWHEVYDFVEYLADSASVEARATAFCAFCNERLERELAGYRFSGTRLVPLTDAEQLKAIERAKDVAEQSGLNGVTIHLDAALAKLADRTAPDYRNSIKESISAIESLVCAIMGDSKAELGRH